MKTVVNFNVKATINTEDAKQAKQVVKDLKAGLALVSAVDTKVVVKQIKDA
jgi:hypothetical protein